MYEKAAGQVGGEPGGQDQSRAAHRHPRRQERGRGDNRAGAWGSRGICGAGGVPGKIAGREKPGIARALPPRYNGGASGEGAMAEREPMNWSMPLPGSFLGVSVRVHILFPIVALGLILWVATSREFASGRMMWTQACVVLAMLFACVLLHEFGHVIGARRVGGDVMELLLWPLGGLAEADVPPTPGCHFWAAIYGPVVNLALAVFAGTALAVLGFVPPLNPLDSPLNPRMYNWHDGRTYFSVANPGQAEFWYYQDADQEWQLVKITEGRSEDGSPYLAHATQSVEAGTENGARWRSEEHTSELQS